MSGAVEDLPLLDMLYIKLAGNRGFERMPLCEMALIDDHNVYELDVKLSNPTTLVLVNRTPNGKMFKITREVLIATVQNSVYSNMYKVADIAWQAAGTPPDAQLHAFLEKHRI